jgi:hypothetical protein
MAPLPAEQERVDDVRGAHDEISSWWPAFQAELADRTRRPPPVGWSAHVRGLLDRDLGEVRAAR